MGAAITAIGPLTRTPIKQLHIAFIAKSKILEYFRYDDILIQVKWNFSVLN
jgi:hypothetical protein